MGTSCDIDSTKLVCVKCIASHFDQVDKIADSLWSVVLYATEPIESEEGASDGTVTWKRLTKQRKEFTMKKKLYKLYQNHQGWETISLSKLTEQKSKVQFPKKD